MDATFVQSGKYRKRGDAWELIRRETALPSRLAVQCLTLSEANPFQPTNLGGFYLDWLLAILPRSFCRANP